MLFYYCLPHSLSGRAHALEAFSLIASYNRCASGVRAALPELVLIYEPSPITTQARHYATRGSIMTAALPFGCGLTALLLDFELLLLAVSLPRFVMYQDVAFGMLIQYIPVMICCVDWIYPVTRCIDYLNPCGSSLCAAHDQHRRQACG